MTSTKTIPANFAVSPIPTSSVIWTYLDREQIQMDPDYQREGNVWSLEKRQLLIDSIINQFDIPKFYWHEFLEPRKIAGRRVKYAVIDGKQRLQAVWDFIDNKFTLGDSVEYLHDPSVHLSGLTYTELADRFPKVKALFDNYPLSIMGVRTDDVELIEDMFSRLNEAVPLSAAEKRNAFGGPLPTVIRSLCLQKFFKSKLPFQNSRYRHFDLACKFLLLAHKDKPTDTKKIHLDAFVKNAQALLSATEVQALKSNVVATLNAMAHVFIDRDRLLRNVGTVAALFLIFMEAGKHDERKRLSRASFQMFEDSRESNSIAAATDISTADYSLLRFDEIASTINDEYAINFRAHLIATHVLGGKSKTTKAFALDK